MRKLLTLIALVGALAATQCFALQVKVQWLPGYHVSGFGGGEFNVSPVIGHGYDADVLVQKGFETFCYDETKHIIIPGNYVALAPVPVGGNNAAKVCWLFSQFATGVLAQYDYNPLATRADSAQQLQIALWSLLGQVPAPNPGSLAATFIGEIPGDVSGDYFVSVLPLNDLAGNPVQPMFILDTPQGPDGGLTVLLLGMALTGLGWFSRRCKA